MHDPPNTPVAMSRVRHVVLIGLMASGKSSVGPRLATRLGVPFVDNDALLQARTGRSARQIETADGLDALHRNEAEVLQTALGGAHPAVVAAAAGAVLDAPSALAGHDVVYLRVLPAVLAARLAASDDGHRPRLDIDALFTARDADYSRLATMIVDAERSPDAIVDEITNRLARPAP
jgi:shikimate kinase